MRGDWRLAIGETLGFVWSASVSLSTTLDCNFNENLMELGKLCVTDVVRRLPPLYSIRRGGSLTLASPIDFRNATTDSLDARYNMDVNIDSIPKYPGRARSESPGELFEGPDIVKCSWLPLAKGGFGESGIPSLQ